MKDLLGVIKHKMEYVALSAGTFLKKSFPEANQLHGLFTSWAMYHQAK